MPVRNKVVTVICLCYNHAPFLEEAVRSVLKQEGVRTQIILVDDFSIDDSRTKIALLQQEYPDLLVVMNERNEGNCRSFNKALRWATGDYIIDFATDDVMPPERLKKQVAFFEKQNSNVGVVYTNVALINRVGNYIKTLYPQDVVLPEGDVFEALLTTSFIMPSSMMIRKAVLDELDGYDTTLTYEDFDFWVRSARTWYYAYQPEVLMKQRVLSGSYSTRFTQRKNDLVPSTVKVCEKALKLIRTESEKKALIHRLKRVMRQCLFTENTDALQQTFMLLAKLDYKHPYVEMIKLIAPMNLPLHRLYRAYLWLKSLLSLS